MKSLKLKALNQTITVVQGTGFIGYPFFDVNYASATIIVGDNVKIFGEEVDKDLLNQIIGKGTIKILSQRYSSLNAEANVIYDWLLSKTNFIKDIKECGE